MDEQNNVIHMGKYPFPKCLTGICKPEEFQKWLNSKAQVHVKRDRNRGMIAKRELYKIGIYEAVLKSKGLDAYTGKPLRWKLINKYDNGDAIKRGKEYKKEFGDLPTVDHVYDSQKKLDFEVCSWRVNDCKNDLSLQEFINVCNDVLRYYKKVEKK